MHNHNVIWFDTSACLEGPHIGEVNRPNSNNYEKVSTWKASYQTLAITDDYNWNDIDMYRDFRRAMLETIEDCDVDCQAKGSQLTMIAGLLGIVYFLVGLNALAMFIGTWRYRWRVCSIYCTLFACLFQFAIIVTSATMLFSSYTLVLCAGSLTDTAPGMPWTMADDWSVNVMLWVAQIFLMFGFLACGLCSAMKDETA